MQTKVITSSNIESYAPSLVEVAAALRDGALVIIPTETVYGVGANATHAGAMKRLRELKGTGDHRPFTVHLGQRAEAARYVSSPSPLLRRLARKIWPGPLTLIAEERAPDQVDIARLFSPPQLEEVFHEATVGLRCPDHSATQRLLREAGVPVVASSANVAGGPPPIELSAALEVFGGRVEYAMDGGRTRFGAASTVVEVRGNEWHIRRPGVLDERTLHRAARSIILMVCTGNSCRSPMAEALFRQQLAERQDCPPADLTAAGYEVASAGTCALPNGRASEGALAEMARRGLDIGTHRSRPLTTELLQQAERIYVMSGEHRSAALERAPAAAERIQLLDPEDPVVDPLGGGADEYRRCAAHIERAIAARLKEFLDEDRNW